MLPVNCGSHADYQDFVVTHLCKYYPDPDALARSTWDQPLEPTLENASTNSMIL